MVTAAVAATTAFNIGHSQTVRVVCRERIVIRCLLEAN
jgi:hypothetical protein